MKLSRHSKILDLISKYNIDTQEELAKKLSEDGYNVTQATVSRDIKDLKLVKVLDNSGLYKYAQSGVKETTATGKNLSSILINSVTKIDNALNTVVIKTHSGMAQAVGFVIDSLEFEEILGCVAGDDTIICVTKTEKAASYLVDKLNLMLKN